MKLTYNYNQKITPGLVQKYNSEIYPNDKVLIQSVINYNKRDLITTINIIKSGTEIPFIPDINKIRKNLKKKSKKFVISKTINTGNMYRVGATNEEGNFKTLLFPYGDYMYEPCSMIRFRYYKRNNQFITQFQRLIMSLKSSKVDFSHEIIKNNGFKNNGFKNNGVNYIEFKVNDPSQNDTFWYVVNLWAKK